MNLFDKKFVHFMWDDSLVGKEGFFADYINKLVGYVENEEYKFICKEEGDSEYPFLTEDNTKFCFFYYDPLYDVKLAWKEGKQIQYKNKGSPDSWKDCAEEPYWAEACEYRVKPEEPTFRVYKCSDDTLHVSNSCIIDFIFEGTEQECEQYIKEHYCDRCSHQSCGMKAGTQFCKGFKKVKQRRRKTNRELAQWAAQGNGQVKYRDGNCAYNTFNGYDVRDDDKPCPDYFVIRGWDETEWHEPEVEE